MAPITIYKHDSGEWVTDWYGKPHHVTLNATTDESFVTLGLFALPAVRFEINNRGVIHGVFDNRTDHNLAEVTIPVNHALHRELNIGKPV